MKLVGITGRAGAGKDTAADALTYSQSFLKMSFATPLKEAAKDIFNLSDKQLYDPVAKEIEDPRWGMTPRRILQLMGTDAMRGTFGGDIWIKAARVRMEAWEGVGENFVFADVRFEDEAEFIRESGGIIINIKRPGISLDPSAASHASEAGIELRPGDYEIQNTGSILKLCEMVALVVEEAFA